jgi:hypothetical protein
MKLSTGIGTTSSLGSTVLSRRVPIKRRADPIAPPPPPETPLTERNAFHQCLADLPEIQRTNPAAFAGLRKLEAAKRRGQSREAAARATGDRLTATWTVARSGKSRNEFDHRERARSGGWTGNPYATPWNRPASPRG